MLRKTASRLTRRPISAFLSEPSERRTFEETLASCSKQNIDMASGLSSEFLLIQSKLFKYRIARVATEVQYVCRHPFGCFPSAKMTAMHAFLLPIVFIVATWIGRGSCTSLVAPPRVELANAPADAGMAVAADSEDKKAA